MWIPRILSEQLKKLIKTRPAILLTGVRQSGKSSLLKHLFPSLPYVTFDHPNQVLFAQESPERFLSNFPSGAILDEIQYVPELFRYLKITIDENPSNYGRWILTGSQRFELMRSASESLAGRISVKQLETLSSKELRSFNHPNLKEYLWIGGYPELWKNTDIDKTDYFESYSKTYLEKDLQMVIQVRDLNVFRKFIQLLSSRIGQILNYQDMARDVGVSDVTIKTWVSGLEQTGLIYLLPPYYLNFGKRVIKSPKLYFADHGLASYLVGIEQAKDWEKHPLRGNLWENLVMMELVKTHGFAPGRNLFYFRDQNAGEIDFVIEHRDKVFLMEAKSTESLSSSKLQINKYKPLFSKEKEVTNVLACRTLENHVLYTKDVQVFNPLLCSYEFI